MQSRISLAEQANAKLRHRLEVIETFLGQYELAAAASSAGKKKSPLEHEEQSTNGYDPASIPFVRVGG